MRFSTPLLLTATLILTACSGPERAVPPPAAAVPPFQPPVLAHFEPMRIPDTNPLTAEKVALGRQLFSDPRLSSDGTTSCSGCHSPQYGYTVGAARPIGAYGVEQNRACPSLINAGYAKGYYWENAPIPLEKAVLGMWKFVMVPQGEGRPTAEEVAARLGPGLTPEKVAEALASFIRTLVPVQAPWVRYYGGETAALSEAGRRGFEVFDRKAHCTNCHSSVLLADRLRHDVGTGNAFKTPTLLNVARSAPYFHDNRVPTLEAAVDQMLAGGFATKTPDPQLKPVTITPEERALLLTFLRELNADV
ncbi:MAG: cytochrome c peroxidase [Acidobacteriota bacterium]